MADLNDNKIRHFGRLDRGKVTTAGRGPKRKMGTGGKTSLVKILKKNKGLGKSEHK